MLRRFPALLLAGVLAITVACTNKKVVNPIANVDSKQPDKVLFDRSMNALKHNRYDEARINLQTLINTYPDSEFLARAKLGVADSWYAEGGSSAMAQADAEYNDFITFFPNMPEAAEAQLKIANIQYGEMEKPDRDYTHAVRAEDEYRKVILQYPDNAKMVALAKQRLLQVQEVIAEREFRVGDFYFMHGNYPAAIARLSSLAAKYPLYSKADETLYMLGQSYQIEAELVRMNRQFSETMKANMVQSLEKSAVEAYSTLLQRYPVMDRADEAKARLRAMHQPIPKPTKAAIAQNRAEEASRHQDGMMARMLNNFSHHPNVSTAATVGEPTLVDPKQMSVTEVEKQMNTAVGGGAESSGKVGGEILGTGSTVPDQGGPDPNVAPGDSPAATQPDAAPAPAAAAGDDSNELKPNVTSADPNPAPASAASSNDPNELKPNVAGTDQPQTPPSQVNEIQPPAQPDATTQTATPAAASPQQDDDSSSSSKHKKKKGLKKVIPF